MADVLNFWRVNLRVMERSASRPGVTRKDMLSLLSNLKGMTPGDVTRLTRLFTLAPKSQWADAIRRQPGYNAPEDTTSNKSSVTDSQTRATATKRCPVCGTYCTNRHTIDRCTRLDGQWYCTTCLDNLTN